MFETKEKIKYYTEREVRKKGKYDGRSWRWRLGWPLWEAKDAIPAINDEHLPPYEKQIIKSGNGDLRRLAQVWAETDQELHTRCHRAGEVCQNVGEKRESQKKKEGEEESLQEYNAAKKSFDEYPKPHLPSWVGFPIILIMALAEGSFNLVAFNVLGESRFGTFLMAMGVLIAIPLAGWFIGSGLALKVKTRTRVIMMMITSLAVIGGLSSVTILRETFLEAIKIKDTMGIEMESFTMGMIFFGINMFIFMVIIAIEYAMSHDDPNAYHKAKEHLQRACNRLAKEERTAKEMEVARTELRSALTARNAGFQEITEKAESKRDSWYGLMQAYRDANVSVRKSGESCPNLFKAELNGTIITMPTCFNALTWETGEEQRYADLLEEAATKGRKKT